MAEPVDKNTILVVGIMVVVAVAGIIFVLFLNKDYQSALAQELSSSNQQANEMDNSVEEKPISQKIFGKADSTIDACVDFDNGKNYYVKGNAVWKEAKGSDFCEVYNEPGGWTQVNSCLAGDRRCSVAEKYCDSNAPNNIGQEDIYCEYGCKDGACLSSCTDSDGGDNYYVAGKAHSDDGMSFSDVCSFLENPNGILLESVCEGGSAWRVQVVCPSEAPYCSGGVCSKNKPKCEDSDGGLNYQLRGSVNYGEGARFYLELCKSNIVLLEQYCENGYPKSKEYTCPNGCKDGVCINPAQNGKCTDSDGGQDYDVKGTAYGINGKNSDYCFEGNTKTLVELYCDEQGKVQNIYHDCPNGCSDGVCLNSPAEIKCSDSDGDNIFVKGQMTTNHPNWIAGEKIDYCAVSRDNGLSGVMVQQCAGAECYIEEFYCISEQQPSARFVPCSNGCKDGACIGGEKG